jgi:hypothetical protein
MLCAPGLVFVGIEGVGSLFHVLRSQTHFRRCRVRRVPFSCFVFTVSFSAVSSASGPVFMLCSPVLVFSGAECLGSRFHGLRARTNFLRYRGRREPFSCLARPYSFSTVPRASFPVFMFCALVLIFGGTEGVVSLFHVLSSQTHFRRYRERRVSFSSFPRPDSCSAVPRASGPVFIFCTPGLVFGGAKGVVSRIQVLRVRTRFRRY